MQVADSQFGDWVQEHHAAVYRTAYRLVQSREDAQDVTQEVFIQALEQRERLKTAEEPGRVLCWMAAKKALMHLRGDRRRKQREDEVAAMQEREYIQTENGDPVARLLTKLPEELRLALSLRFQEELTFAQISEAMEISEPSAHDRVQRGLAKLRGWLQRGSPALLAVDLEQQLRQAPPAQVPAGLSARLIKLQTLGAPAMTLASKLLLAGGALVIAAASIGAIALSGDPKTDAGSLAALNENSATITDDEQPRPTPTTRESRVAVSAPTTALALTTRAMALKDAAPATISGRVLQADSSPAAGVLVYANSYIGSSMKIAAYSGSATTDEQGAYTMQVAVHHDDGEDYEVRVRYEKAILTEPASVRVSAGENKREFNLMLPGLLQETDGEYELSLAITDEAGTRLPAGSIITLERYLSTVGSGTYPHWEAGGRLDVAGCALLTGTKLGPKRVRASVRVGDEWVRYECFFDVERSGPQILEVAAKLISRNPVTQHPGEQETRKFGLSGTASELRTGESVRAVYHDVWFYEVPELTPREFLYDFLPNKIFRGPFQSAAFSESPPVTDRFGSLYSLEPGRYVAMGYEVPYAPTFSDVVELTEEFPRADDLTLRYDMPGSVEGIVRDDNGKPLTGAILIVTGTGPISDLAIASIDDLVRKSHGEGEYRIPSWKTDEKGRFAIDGLSPEIPIRVIALHPTREPAGSRTVFVSSGVTLASLDIQFQHKRAR